VAGVAGIQKRSSRPGQGIRIDHVTDTPTAGNEARRAGGGDDSDGLGAITVGGRLGR
jgi:hypothetical protein